MLSGDDGWLMFASFALIRPKRHHNKATRTNAFMEYALSLSRIALLLAGYEYQIWHIRITTEGHHHRQWHGHGSDLWLAGLS
jgi:hypothetical protein